MSRSSGLGKGGRGEGGRKGGGGREGEGRGEGRGGGVSEGGRERGKGRGRMSRMQLKIRKERILSIALPMNPPLLVILQERSY